MSRNPAAEHLLLAAVTTDLDHRQRQRFAAQVAERLAMGEAAYGSRWREMGIERLLIEVSEEAADIGGWGTLAAQAPDLPDLDPDGTAIRHLIAAMRHAALAFAALEVAAEEIDRNGAYAAE